MINQELIIYIYSFILGRYQKTQPKSSMNNLIMELLLQEKKLTKIEKIMQTPGLKYNFKYCCEFSRCMTYHMSNEYKFSMYPLLVSRCKGLYNLVKDITINNFNLEIIVEINNNLEDVGKIQEYYVKKYHDKFLMDIDKIFSDKVIWDEKYNIQSEILPIILLKNITNPNLKYINEFLINFNVFIYKDYKNFLTKDLYHLNNLNNLFIRQLIWNRERSICELNESITDRSGVGTNSWKMLYLFIEINRLPQRKFLIKTYPSNSQIDRFVRYLSHQYIITETNRVFEQVNLVDVV